MFVHSKGLMFALKTFYALVINKPLDESKLFNRIEDPTKPSIFQEKSLTRYIIKMLIESPNQFL